MVQVANPLPRNQCVIDRRGRKMSEILLKCGDVSLYCNASFCPGCGMSWDKLRLIE
jgi:hypothetical protein